MECKVETIDNSEENTLVLGDVNPIILPDHAISQHLEELETLLRNYKNVKLNLKQGCQWRYQVCKAVCIALENGVTIDHILTKIKQYLTKDLGSAKKIKSKPKRPVLYQMPKPREYGLNGDLVMILVNNNCNVDSIITFRGMKCTILHAIVQCHGLKKPFHRMLIDSKLCTQFI